MASGTSDGSFYICVAIYESSSDAPTHSPVYEERFTLIKASSDEEARRKAQQAAQAFVHGYKNVHGAEITWTCKRIIDVALMVDDAFEDGAEIYGRYFRDFGAYERFEPRLEGQFLD